MPASHIPGGTHTKERASKARFPSVEGYKKTCASVFGGPGDPATGHTGYKGDDLRGKMAFAELVMGTALGHLPYQTKLILKYKGKTVVAEKLDIGLGGGPCSDGTPRAIDLWYETAQALGFSGGLGIIEYSHETSHPSEQAPKSASSDPCNVETGIPIVGGGIEAVAEAICRTGKSIGEIAAFTGQVGGVIGFLTSSSGWVRIAKVLFGSIIIIMALNQLSKIGGGPDVVGAAGRAAQAGAAARTGGA
jgi:hypothetical protein